MSKKIIFKRPKDGYNTEKERVLASWSGVSSYNIFYKGIRIGETYADQYYNESCWSYYIDVPCLKTKGRVERLKDVRWDAAQEIERALKKMTEEELLIELKKWEKEDNYV